MMKSRRFERVVTLAFGLGVTTLYVVPALTCVVLMDRNDVAQAQSKPTKAAASTADSKRMVASDKQIPSIKNVDAGVGSTKPATSNTPTPEPQTMNDQQPPPQPAPKPFVDVVADDTLKTFDIQPTFSRLVAIVRRGGFASSMGHDHAIRATDFSGTVAFDSTKPARSSVQIKVNVAGLKVDEEKIRKEHVLQGNPSESDIEQTDANMRATDQLDTKKHTHILFRSTSCKATKQPNVYDVEGTLSIRGVSKPVKFQAGIVVANTQLIGTGILRFKQSSFGYKPYSAALGMMKVSDEVELHIRLVALENDTK